MGLRRKDGKRVRIKLASMVDINTRLAKCLIAEQFPQWRRLALRPVPQQGWDNRSFRLGERMLVRLPSAAAYAAQVEREWRWLPWMRAHLRCAIPEPVARGEPGCGYPWPWSVYRWIAGQTLAEQAPSSMPAFTAALAHRLAELHAAPAAEGPTPGVDNFYRGGALSVYDAQLRAALVLLRGKVDTTLAQHLWDQAAATAWTRPAVWVHGDIAPGNLLLRCGRLAALIDFGQMGVGDPACDLAIAWTYLRAPHRQAFRRQLMLDDDTWRRGRAWALWKAAIVAARLVSTSTAKATAAGHTLNQITRDAIDD
jgi:aminoglycoside phosphotransferase (APT) family kinase protein